MSKVQKISLKTKQQIIKIVFWTVFILSVILVGIGILGMSVQILFSKRGRFPEFRIDHNREMRKRKIYCPRTEQKRIDLGKEIYCSGCAPDFTET